MATRTTLAAGDLRAVVAAFRTVLRAHQQFLNRLNVYPVPDGDTGTNMALTLDSVMAELDGLPGEAGMDQVCKAIGHGSLMGARGNSGVILSQLLRGVSEHLGGLDRAGATELAGALVHAADLAYGAVVRPVEGTILTVARAAGTGAARADDQGADLAGVVTAARDDAAEALERTPELLEALRRAGVVDAGGSGYLLFLDALASVVDGRPLPDPPAGPERAVGAGATGSPDGDRRGDRRGGTEAGHSAPSDLRYEVMYLLHAPDDTIGPFKEVWAGIGDSIVVVGGDGLWNCHIHTDDIGAAVEAGLDAGRPHQIRVTDLLEQAEQVEEERWVREGALAPSDEPDRPAPTSAVVAVVTGDGVARIFRSLGVQRLVLGGQSMNPSTSEMLEAIDSLASDQVIVLPNNRNIRPVAEQAGALSSKKVRVVPTESIVEGFSALMAYDPASGADENEAAMRASAARVVSAEVTRAVRNAVTTAGTVREGEWIGLANGEVVVVADSPAGAAFALLDRVLTQDHELVTLIEGEGATAGDTRRITTWIHDEHPEVATEVHHGGQPLYPYLLGIE